MKLYIPLALLLTGLLAMVGLASAQSNVTAKDPIIKIAVFADGRLTADGAPASIEKLKGMLKVLAEHHGAVWYYRESSQHDPAPIAMEVLKEIVALRLPIRLSSKPDYSDSVTSKPPQ